MTETTPAARTLTEQAGYLVGVAARAPSLHNTQPWRFTVSGDAIELRADLSRRLLMDPDGREMIISCGAALYGLRLAVRSLGYLPEVELLRGPDLPEVELLRGPDGGRPLARGPDGGRPLARVRLGQAAPMTPGERKMLVAVPHRHTHRGPFEAGPLPAGLLARLRDDARAEGATLTVIAPWPAREQLNALIVAAGRRQDRDSRSQAETWRWSREVNNPARDGVPAHAFPAVPCRERGQLPQRDFDLGRGVGMLSVGGPAPPVTAVLSTSGDAAEDWLHAGQALQRLLLHAATRWVFASLNTQPLEDAVTRTRIADCLALTGAPQMLLALGVSRTARAVGRRPAADVIEP